MLRFIIVLLSEPVWNKACVPSFKELLLGAGVMTYPALLLVVPEGVQSPRCRRNSQQLDAGSELFFPVLATVVAEEGKKQTVGYISIIVN